MSSGFRVGKDNDAPLEDSRLQRHHRPESSGGRYLLGSALEAGLRIRLEFTRITQIRPLRKKTGFDPSKKKSELT